MASVVDICNLAEGNMWQDAVITEIVPPDGTVAAKHASVFYPIARDKLLEMHAWSFATVRMSLAEFSTNEAEDSWAFSYALPADYLKAHVVLLPSAGSDLEAQKHAVEMRSDGQRVLYTDAEDAVLKYTRTTTDTSLFTPQFVTALSFLLAQYMAGPITKNVKTVKSMRESFFVEYALATAADASTSRKDLLKNHNPKHLAARAT